MAMKMSLVSSRAFMFMTSSIAWSLICRAILIFRGGQRGVYQSTTLVAQAGDPGANQECLRACRCVICA